MVRDFPTLLASAQQGDAVGIEALYREMAPLVLGYFRAHGASDPEDLASDVFVAMIAGLARFEGDERAFRSWLMTIAYRRLVDQYRRLGRRRDVPLDEHAINARPIDGEAVAMERLRVHGALDAIDQLTIDQRAALLLRALADLTVPEIAVVMDKPETAVKALLRRANARLARTLVDDDDVIDLRSPSRHDAPIRPMPVSKREASTIA